MDWDDLKIFLAVAQMGSIRSAAAQLGVNHATVSRRITAFESQLGVRLFERQSSGYVKTAAGEELEKTAENLQEQIHAVERRIVGQDARLTGEIRVTLPDMLAATFLMPDLASFTAQYPGITLELIPSYEVFNLSKREADIAIRVTNRPPEHLVGRRLATYAVADYASIDYLAKHDPMNKPDDCRWIGWDDMVPYPKWVLDSHYPTVPIHNRINNALTQLAAVKAGMGMASLPCFLADPEKNLQRLPPGKAEPRYDIWMLTHEDLRFTARIKTFMDFMANAFKKHQALLQGLD